MVSETSLEGKSQPRFTTGRWNPHHNCVQIATANDTCIRGWDLRTLQLATSFSHDSFLLTCSVICDLGLMWYGPSTSHVCGVFVCIYCW